MRVAVAAQIKRGKSTLVNALLGQDVAPTAQLEATFTVGEFYQAAEPRVTVHFNEPGAETLAVAPDQFARYTVNDPRQAALLRRIRKVEYGLPNPLLGRFRLLDTPGLGSIYQADSQNTLMTLGVDGFLDAEERGRLQHVLGRVGRGAAEMHRDTVQALDGADAVIYLFDRGLNQHDASLVVRFLGPLGPSFNALKVVGVLSRCDQWYWPPAELGADPLSHDPLAEGRKIAARRLAEQEVRRMFFRILPVAALASAGATALDAERLSWLDELAAADPRRLATALSDANLFARSDSVAGVSLPKAARGTIVATLGAWGTLKAALYRRDGVELAELRRLLDADSGVADVRRTLVEHFGNRAAALKLDQALREVSSHVARLRMDSVSARSPLPTVVNYVAGTVERVRLSQSELAELAVLEDYYHGRLELEADIAEVLRVTGEHGRSVPARLGQPDGAPLASLITLADERAGAWANRGEALGLDGATAAAARQIATSYGLLSVRARKARQLLGWDDDTDGEG